MLDLYHGDCLDILPTLPAQSVDAIIADPPYGTTACKWDSVIPLDAMWRELKRVIKPNGAIVLFGAQPFTSALVMSNAKWFKYELIHKKRQTGAPGVARIRPLPVHETVLVFGDGRLTYNPEMGEGKPYKVTSRSNGNRHGFGFKGKEYTNDNPGVRYPTSVIECSQIRYAEHPTQKPVDLMRYLVRTYTNAGETVLDFTAGSGSTGVAALMEGRKFIGIEKEANYYAIMERRCAEAIAQPALVTENA